MLVGGDAGGLDDLPVAGRDQTNVDRRGVSQPEVSHRCDSGGVSLSHRDLTSAEQGRKVTG